MATATDALRVAAAEIGYTRWNDPQTGTKYGRWYAKDHGAYFGANGVSYCAMFVSWCLAKVGMTPPGGHFAYVPYGINQAQAAGALVSKANAQPGDLVCFDWNGDGVADHVGFVEVNRGSYYQTIEGNTSSGVAGSQSNGGGVYRRTRSTSVVIAVIRPAYGAAAVTAKTASTTTSSANASAAATKKTKTDHQDMLDVDGDPGTRTYARLEQVMGAKINGVMDEPEPAIVAFQKFLNTVVSRKDIKNLTGAEQLDVDGYDGEKTWKVFQYWIWNRRPDFVKAFMPSATSMPAWVDGIDGAATWKALQTCLNGSWAGSGKLLSK